MNQAVKEIKIPPEFRFEALGFIIPSIVILLKKKMRRVKN